MEGVLITTEMEGLELGGNQGGSSMVKSGRDPLMWVPGHGLTLAMGFLPTFPGRSPGRGTEGWVTGETRETTT